MFKLFAKRLLINIALLFTLVFFFTTTTHAASLGEYIKYYSTKISSHIGCYFDNAEDCYFLGKLYLLKEPNDTAYYYNQACNLKTGESCYELANRYLSGYGVTKNLYVAEDLYRIGCNLNIGVSCGVLAEMYANDVGLTDDKFKREANELYEKACELNVGSSCRALAVIYENESLVKDRSYNLSKAVDLYQKACDLNNSLSCLLLANAYAQGNGVIPDTDKAIDIIEKFYIIETINRTSLSFKNRIGCTDLKPIYHNTEIKDPRLVNVIQSRQRTCDLGYGINCLGLDILNSININTNANLNKITQIREKLCNINYAPACALLARTYERDDLSKAIQYSDKACNLNNGSGCFVLANIFNSHSYELQQNHGISKDIINQIALEAYTKACNLGHDRGCIFEINISARQKDNTDLINAVKLNQEKCNSGDVAGCIFLSWFYSPYLLYVDKPNDLTEVDEPHKDIYKQLNTDINTVIHYNEKACNLGYVEGCDTLTSIYRFKRGGYGSYDFDKAVELMHKLCDLGKDCSFLGHVYETELYDVERDLSKAFHFNQKGCELENK